MISGVPRQSPRAEYILIFEEGNNKLTHLNISATMEENFDNDKGIYNGRYGRREKDPI